MTYNDFPILNPTDYQLINSKFQKQTPKADRATTIAQISMLLLDCKNSCSTLKAETNQLIKREIENINNQISSILENLNSTTQSTHIKQFNLFQFLNTLTKCLNKFILWSTNETKEYYKNLIQKSIEGLSLCIEHLTLAISKSNIKIYKFM